MIARGSSHLGLGWKLLPLFALLMLSGCDEFVPRDTTSLLFSGFKRSELIGFSAGLGTTFAGLPDLIAMLGVFQIFWVYYGLLIASRPVIAWNVIAVLINLSCVAAYRHFARKEQARAQSAD